MNDVTLSVKEDVRQVLADLQHLNDGGNVYRAVASALLRAGRTVVSRSAREIAKDSGLPVRLVRGRFSRDVNAQGRRRLRAVWRARLGPVPVHALGTARTTRRGVAVGRRSYPGAFLARDQHGRESVFRRKGPSRLPIEKITVPLVDADATIRRHMQTTGAQRFKIEARRALRVALRNPSQIQSGKRFRR